MQAATPGWDPQGRGGSRTRKRAASDAVESLEPTYDIFMESGGGDRRPDDAPYSRAGLHDGSPFAEGSAFFDPPATDEGNGAGGLGGVSSGRRVSAGTGMAVISDATSAQVGDSSSVWHPELEARIDSTFR